MSEKVPTKIIHNDNERARANHVIYDVRFGIKSAFNMKVVSPNRFTFLDDEPNDMKQTTNMDASPSGAQETQAMDVSVKKGVSINNKTVMAESLENGATLDAQDIMHQ